MISDYSYEKFKLEHISGSRTWEYLKKNNYDHQTKVMEISNLKFNQVIFNTLNYLYNLPIPENKYLKKPHWISSKNKSSVKKDIQTFKIKPQSNDGFNLFFFWTLFHTLVCFLVSCSTKLYAHIEVLYILSHNIPFTRGVIMTLSIPKIVSFWYNKNHGVPWVGSLNCAIRTS